MAEINPYAVSQPPDDEVSAAAKPSALDKAVAIILRPAVVLSLFAVVHFLGSLAYWLVASYLLAPSRSSFVEWLHFLWPAFPAALLAVGAGWCLARGIRGKRYTLPMILTVLLLSGGLFWYDVSHHRSQIQVNFAPVEYWQNGGSRHTYCTWWWYEDGWFR